MTQCAQHVQFQLPNEYTRVGYLLTAIQSTDPKLQAAMANVDGDTDANGKRNNFESAAAYLLPKDPVARNRNNKRPNASISDADVTDRANISAFGTKPGKGKTGVHFCYYKPEEYATLSKAQKQELKTWREAQKSNDKEDKKTGNEKNLKNISSTIAKEIEKQLKGLKKDADTAAEDEKKVESYIMSVMKKHAEKGNDHSDKPNKRVRISENEEPASSSALQSILRRVKK